jgi:hypothetical protein
MLSRVEMATGRVSAGTVFARPIACPRPHPLPACQPAHSQKSVHVHVHVPDGYPRVQANPSPAIAALLGRCGEPPTVAAPGGDIDRGVARRRRDA